MGNSELYKYAGEMSAETILRRQQEERLERKVQAGYVRKRIGVLEDGWHVMGRIEPTVCARCKNKSYALGSGKQCPTCKEHGAIINNLGDGTQD